MVEPGADPVQIEKEPRDRKAKYRGLLDAERAWEERHGIAPLRDRLQHAEAELSQLKPISAAGCAALVAYATEDLAAGEGPEWPMAALANVVEALKNIAARWRIMTLGIDQVAAIRA